MALPHVFTNSGHPTIDATQFNDNFTYLDTGKNREGTVDDAPADGSESLTVTFSPAFSNTIGGVTIEIFNYSGSETPFVALSHHIIGTPNKSGFSFVVGGGDPGTTCSIFFRASGT